MCQSYQRLDWRVNLIDKIDNEIDNNGFKFIMKMFSSLPELKEIGLSSKKSHDTIRK